MMIHIVILILIKTVSGIHALKKGYVYTIGFRHKSLFYWMQRLRLWYTVL